MRFATTLLLPYAWGLSLLLASTTSCGSQPSSSSQGAAATAPSSNATGTVAVVAPTPPAAVPKPTTAPAPQPSAAPAPATTPPGPPPPSFTPVKMCAKVTADDRAAGLATTFDDYTAVVTANCGGGGCHVGALPHGFVGDLGASKDAAYSTGILVDLSNGTMPKGKSITTMDVDVITNYLCARLDI